MRRTQRTRGHHREGFTLIELMLAIAIILILIALLIPAIRAIMVTVNNRRIQMEMQQITLAIDQYSNDHGEAPPTMIGDPGNGTTRNVDLQRLRAHLRRAFPKLIIPPNGDLGTGSGWRAQTSTHTVDLRRLDGAEVWVFFVGGLPIMDGNGTRSVEGFAADPARPFLPTSVMTQRDRGDYEFVNARFSDIDNDGLWEYTPPGYANRPYVYFRGEQYLVTNSLTAFYPHRPGSSPFGVAVPYATTPTNFSSAAANPNVWHKPESFQLVWCGQDTYYQTIGPSQIRFVPNLVYPADTDNLANFSDKMLGDEQP